VACDAGDAGAGDCEGEEGEGRALGGEGEEQEKDWVLLKGPSKQMPLFMVCGTDSGKSLPEIEINATPK